MTVAVAVACSLTVSTRLVSRSLKLVPYTAGRYQQERPASREYVIMVRDRGHMHDGARQGPHCMMVQGKDRIV